MCSRRSILAVLFIGLALLSLSEAASKRCKWHGTAPACNLASCPSDKQIIKQSSCGKNKLFCCLTGQKLLCCPKTMGNIDPALAEAIAE